MTTIQDVAREAGVGVGTVSRVLSRHPRVAPATRARVERAIERLGYRPSRAARALAGGRTHTIAVVVPLLTRHYYFGLLAGIVAALADTEYLLTLRVLERPEDKVRALDDLARGGSADGVLLVRTPPTPELLDRLSGVPLALIDGAHPAVPSVGVDHTAAAATMTEHLISLGHERIALIDRVRDPFDQQVLTARRRGYRNSLERAGIRRRPEYEPHTEWSAESGAAALDTLLALPEPPTAVFAGGDTIAIGVLDRARQRGLTVPGDLSVCGYGDIELARYLALTTVHVPVADLGRRGAELLLQAIDAPPAAPIRERLPSSLVVRATCGPRRPPTQ
ncbi:MAG TPA: LacI family DNA-binding transcriptional regulator [Chloroflexota bacterium]|nr:LacI family DNA-binding transcriptional regulator [Chloroflexota bacterium]